ncbi:MAG: hypothetical protein P4M05_13325, partial [Bradyrhizobium sp.]|nr:hypothetical protein [Bradyrhizobium sp.]
MSRGTIGTDGRFGVYRSMDDGVAAAQRQLLLYQDRDHLNTARGIISKWAPPGENNTNGYVDTVAQRMGVKPDEQLNLHDPDVAAKLIREMARIETGRDIGTDVAHRGVEQAQAARALPANAQPAGQAGEATIRAAAAAAIASQYAQSQAAQNLIATQAAQAAPANIQGGSGAPTPAADPT